jgi:flagellar biosynthesis protein FliQ
MTETQIFDILRQGLWVSVLISAPLLMTLTFVPKAALMLVVFWASMSFMTTTLVAFFTDMIIPQIAGG